MATLPPLLGPETDPPPPTRSSPGRQEVEAPRLCARCAWRMVITGLVLTSPTPLSPGSMPFTDPAIAREVTAPVAISPAVTALGLICLEPTLFFGRFEIA